MNDIHSLSHTKWNCKYHIVLAPKYRQKKENRIIRKDSLEEVLQAIDNRKRGIKMYCIKCGNKNPDNANFCYSCGFPFDTIKKDIKNVVEVNNNQTVSIIKEDKYICEKKDHSTSDELADINRGRGLIFAALQNLGSLKIYILRTVFKDLIDTETKIKNHDWNLEKIKNMISDNAYHSEVLLRYSDYILKIAPNEQVNAKITVGIAVYGTEWAYGKPASNFGEINDSLNWYTGCIFVDSPRYGRVLGGQISDVILHKTIKEGHIPVMKHAHNYLNIMYEANPVKEYKGSIYQILKQISGEIYKYSKVLSREVNELSSILSYLNNIDSHSEQKDEESVYEIIKEMYFNTSRIIELIDEKLLDDNGFVSYDLKEKYLNI